jgi:hypothetical protein
MSQKDEKYKVLKGNKIPSVGFPLAIVSLEKFPSVRRAIYFLVLINEKGEATLRKKSFKVSLPHPDEFVFSQIEDAMKDELQKDISAARKANPTEVTPDASFSFNEISSDEFAYYFSLPNTANIYYEIRNLATCDSIRTQLPSPAAMTNWFWQDDKQTFRD